MEKFETFSRKFDATIVRSEYKGKKRQSDLFGFEHSFLLKAKNKKVSTIEKAWKDSVIIMHKKVSVYIMLGSILLATVAAALLINLILKT